MNDKGSLYDLTIPILKYDRISLEVEKKIRFYCIYISRKEEVKIP